MIPLKCVRGYLDINDDDLYCESKIDYGIIKGSAAGFGQAIVDIPINRCKHLQEIANKYKEDGYYCEVCPMGSVTRVILEW